MRKDRLISKFSFFLLLFVLLAPSIVVQQPKSVFSQTPQINQNSVLVVNNMITQIVISSNETKVWTTEIQAMAIIDFLSTTTIQLEFPEKIIFSSVSINDTLSPNKMIHENEKTRLDITPLVQIKKNDVILLKLNGNIILNINKLSEDKSQINYKWGLNYKIPKFDLTLVLPEFNNIGGDVNLLDIIPSGYLLLTNGKSIIINWPNLLLLNPLKTETVIVNINTMNGEIDTQIQSKSNISSKSFAYGIVFGILSLLVLLITYLVLTGMSITEFFKGVIDILKTKGDDEEIKEMKIKTRVIPVILKPQHKKILSIINENEATINQNDLVTYSGLSKGRISQYLKELEDLNIISREKVGRENIIYLNVEVKFD